MLKPQHPTGKCIQPHESSSLKHDTTKSLEQRINSNYQHAIFDLNSFVNCSKCPDAKLTGSSADLCEANHFSHAKYKTQIKNRIELERQLNTTRALPNSTFVPDNLCSNPNCQVHHKNKPLSRVLPYNYNNLTK